jgi:hypothetical protein
MWPEARPYQKLNIKKLVGWVEHSETQHNYRPQGVVLLMGGKGHIKN